MTATQPVVRLTEAEATIRAIGGGEIDAFVISDGESGDRIYTLTTADRPYRMFVENMPDGAATLSPDGVVLYANRRLAELVSCSPEAIVGVRLATLVRGAPFALEVLQSPRTAGTTLELELLSPDGTTVPVLVGSSPLDVDGESLTCLTFTDLRVQKAQAREIERLEAAHAERLTALHEARADLAQMATHDELTGLPNRALLVDRIDRVLPHMERQGGYLAVFFADLDQFHAVNDAHGHAAGNAVLRQAAERLGAILRSVDTVGRLGGDQFVVVAPAVDDDAHAAAIGDQIVAELCRPGDGPADGETVSASVGISISFGGRGNAETLLAEANAAMGQAKARGGARATSFDAELGARVQLRSDARQALQAAIAEHRIVAQYQPIVDLATGDLAGFEALARIAEANGAVLPPSAFIPVAEYTGLIVPVGTEMLSAATQEARSWPMAGPRRSFTVAVNLSPHQFRSGQLPDLVRRSLEASGLEATCLHLELTETATMEPDADTVSQLEEIRDLGVQIGLDDFGTGYASLTHLRRLPLTFVKIDQTFVQGLGADREDERIITAVVDLAANLGLRSVAEGIETEDQLARLREIGCDQGQGYHLGRPRSPDQAQALPLADPADDASPTAEADPDPVASLRQRVLAARRSKPSTPADRDDEVSGSVLSDRELEVLMLLARSVSTERISRELYLSVSTVRNHVQHILYKLEVHTRLEAVALALRQGIISVEDM